MKPTDLRGILRYVPRFRDKIFVVAVDGAVLAHENFANVLLDVAVLRSLNIRVVLVHGISAQIRAVLEASSLSTEEPLDGTGITDASMLEIVLQASARLTHEIMEGLSINHLKAAVPNAITAHTRGILKGRDYQFTGKAEKVDAIFLNQLLDQGVVPVIPPLGFDHEGQTYRVNSDSVALEIAVALRAAKLIFLGTRDGLSLNGDLIRQTAAESLVEELRKKTAIMDDEDRSRAIHAVEACQRGVPRVHVVNGGIDEGLLEEIFSNEGVGTLVYANDYQQIRPARKKDVRSILRLSKQSFANEELVRRTACTIEKRLGDYYIFEIDTNSVACVALHEYPNTGIAEIAHLYVSPSHENQGIGSRLLGFVIEQARKRGLKRIIALSTQAFTWFQMRGGFREGTVEDLPGERKETYVASRRGSRILLKDLT